MKSLFSTVVLLLVLSSCVIVPKAKLDPKTGKLPEKYSLKPYNVITAKNIDFDKYTQFLYVRLGGTSLEGHPYEIDQSKYLMDALRLTGGFKKYFVTKDLEQFIVDNKLKDQGVNITNSIGLYNLSEKIGKFLVCDINLREDSSQLLLMEFKVTDPTTNQVVFHVRFHPNCLDGGHRCFFNPVLNGFGKWMKANLKYA